MGTISEKLTYLNETKQELKEAINNLGGEIDNNTTFREYAEELDTIYSNLPKVTGTGTSISLTPTYKGKLESTVKGNTSQTTLTGKNLFNKNIIQENYRLNMEGLRFHDDGYFISDFISVLPSTSYTKNSPIADAYHRFAFYQTASETSFISISGNNTETTPSNCYYLRFCGILTELDTTQLEKGSTATTYEQYCGGIPSPNPSYPQNIKVVTGDNSVEVVGTNLFNGTLESGYYNTSTKTLTSTTSTVFKSFAIKLKSGNVTLSCNTKINIVRAFTDYNNSSDVIFNGTVININSYTMNITEDTTLYISVKRNDNTNWLDTDLIQVEYGTSATSYTPYHSTSYPISLGSLELCKIGTYQDYIYKDNGKWYKYGAIGKEIFNGSESWNLRNTTTNGTKTYSLKASDTPEYKTENVTSSPSGMAYCKAFTVNRTVAGVGNMYGNYDVTMKDIICLCLYYNSATPNDRAIYINTTETLSTYFTNNPSEFYYKLPTATDTEITDTTLINQLNNLEKAMSENGTTNISSTYESGNAQMIITASSLKGN